MAEGRIIVTGGAGFIGSALVWRLNELGEDDILVIDRLDESESWKNLRTLRFADYINKWEFLDGLDRFKGAGTILHMGACSSTTETNAKYVMHNNYAYTRDLADWAVANDVRFIYASSAATYGDGSAGMRDGVGDLDKLRPLNVYGYSKHLFDRYAARKGYFDRIVGLKYFNVFGPNENHKGDMRSLVNKAFDQVSETGRLRLFKSANPDYADGEFGRDFLYIKDAIEMTLFFLECPIGGLFNVGSGRMNTWNELASVVFAAMGREPAIEYVDMPDHLRGKYQYHTQADIGRMREAGFGLETLDLGSAVSDYVTNYLIPGKYLGD